MRDMLNQVIIVGRLVDQPQMEGDSCYIKLAVPRSFKNENGEYETDFIIAKLWGGVATNTCEYCKKGDVIGIRGRLQSNENGLELIADKITFLTTNKEILEREGK
jgi:single-strand DNA-binding protein